MRMRAAALLVLGSILASASVDARSASETFVDVSREIEGLIVEMRYFGSDNFTGRPVAGYEAPVCLLTREAASALADVQQRLKPFGLGLKVFDCYRPVQAVADFVAWAKDLQDERRKAEYYPSVPKTELFKQGYIADRSSHSRGSTVDVTLVDLRSRTELSMGSPYDFFDPISWPAAAIDPDIRAKRLLLQTLMSAAGFAPYEQEWWHFTLKNEPFPDTYFDFPVAVL